MKGNPDSGIQEIFAHESGIQKIFDCGIWNLTLLHPESWIQYLGSGVHIMESGIQDRHRLTYMGRTQSLIFESGIHWGEILNPVPWIRGPHHGIWNPRLSWINLHGEKSEPDVRMRNPLRWTLESSAWDPDSTSWNPESKTFTNYQKVWVAAIWQIL